MGRAGASEEMHTQVGDEAGSEGQMSIAEAGSLLCAIGPPHCSNQGPLRPYQDVSQLRYHYARHYKHAILRSINAGWPNAFSESTTDCWICGSKGFDGSLLLAYHIALVHGVLDSVMAEYPFPQPKVTPKSIEDVKILVPYTKRDLPTGVETAPGSAVPESLQVWENMLVVEEAGGLEDGEEAVEPGEEVEKVGGVEDEDVELVGPGLGPLVQVGGTAYKCSHCSQICASKRTLRNHLKKSTKCPGSAFAGKLRPIYCPHCPVKVGTPDKLEQHLVDSTDYHPPKPIILRQSPERMALLTLDMDASKWSENQYLPDGWMWRFVVSPCR